MMFALDWAEAGLLPDAVIRAGMRRLMAQRLAAHHDMPLSRRTAEFRAFVNQLKAIPLLRWPRHGFFSPKTFATTLIDAIIVMFSLVFFVLVLGAADYIALKIFKVLTLGKA